MNNNFIKSKKFINSKISFGFFTRQGGLSLNNFSSLNCSYNSGDINTKVKDNIMIAQKKLSLDKSRLKFVSQIHSNKTVIINSDNYLKSFEADGMITENKNISIAILTADCCPIFLFDDENKFICCLHAGWKGVFSNIIHNSINLIINIQPNKSKIKAIIGPCLNQKNFEVNDDFKKKFIKMNKDYENYFSKNNSCMNFFNMRGIIKSQLLNNKIHNIDDIDIDTYDNEDLFYSHRRSTHNKRLPAGRMVNIIGFKG